MTRRRLPARPGWLRAHLQFRWALGVSPAEIMSRNTGSVIASADTAQLPSTIAESIPSLNVYAGSGAAAAPKSAVALTKIVILSQGGANPRPQSRVLASCVLH